MPAEVGSGHHSYSFPSSTEAVSRPFTDAAVPSSETALSRPGFFHLLDELFALMLSFLGGKVCLRVVIQV